MSPYMNAYVGQALAPQVSNLNNQLALQSQLTQGAATSAGAYGDPRANMLQQNQNAQGSLQEQGLVGTAYTNAFNTAIGAGAQDVSNNLQGQITNAGLYNTGLANQLAGSNAAYQQGVGGTTLQNTLGAQQTAQTQAQLNASYNQWLMAQQYPFQTTQLVNSAMGAALPTNQQTTLSQPNNSGYAMLGAILGGVGGGIAKSDVRAKTDIEQIGELNDGLNIYRFRYKEDRPGTRRVGLMAQEVELKYPSAVLEIGGVKHVDYDRAISFGIAA